MPPRAPARPGSRAMDREPLAPPLPAPLVHIEGLPALPALARALLCLREGERRAEEVVAALEREPALCERLMRLASAARPGEDAATIKRAVVLLGTRAARLHALAFSLAHELPKDGPAGFDYREYWRRSLIAAVAARAVARVEEKPYQDEAFVAGLLSHLGQLVLATSLPNLYRPVVDAARPCWPSVEVERSLLGFHRADVAAPLLHAWNLPELIRAPVACAHLSQAETHRLTGSARELTHDLGIALRIVELLCHTEGAGMAELAEDIENDLAMDEEELQRFLHELVPEMRAAASFLALEELGEDWISDALARARAHMAEISLGAAFGEPSAPPRRPYAPAAGLDEATGLFTAASFESALAEEIRRRLAGPVGRSLGLLLVELEAAPREDAQRRGLLCEAGAVLRRMTRKSDVPARLSEERFAVLLPETTPEHLEIVAQRARRRIEAEVLARGARPHLRAVVGGACLPRVSSEKDGHVLLALADERLARAHAAPLERRGDVA